MRRDGRKALTMGIMTYKYLWMMALCPEYDESGMLLGIMSGP